MKKTYPRVILINPSQRTEYPQPPLGLAMIAAVLEENSYQVKILDLNVSSFYKGFVTKTVSKEEPDIVGITAFTPTINAAAKVAKKVKEADCNITVILGGPHGTICPEETLRAFHEIDIVVHGEGEQTMLELVKALEKNPKAPKGVPGITYRESPNIRRNPPNSTVEDLDQLPLPAFHLLPIEKYRLHPPFGRLSPAIPIITSRGCPYRCVFCAKAVFGKKYRSNSAEYVAREFQLLKEKFGIREIKFYDDVFTLDRKRVVSICRKLKELGLDIPWTCETRVNLVNQELLSIMRNAGCYMIEYGVESGNQEIIKTLKKDITLDQVVQAFKLTKEARIDTVAYFMIGNPGETPHNIRETIAFAKRLDPDFAQFSITTPYPGTELLELSANWERSSEDWDKYIYSDLRPSNYPAFETEILSRKELKSWHRKAYTSFYFSWSYLWKRLKKMTSLGEFRTNIRGLRMAMDLAWS